MSEENKKIPEVDHSANIETDKEKVNFTKDGKAVKFYPDNPTAMEHKRAIRTKMPTQFYDPCAEASKMSLACMERNNFERDNCIEYFKAYRECKKAWAEERKKDRRNGFRY
ncbi:hypothetical protein NADFUDRAFT_84159 [Nadsonia fulvescens var. elongata DSM 6958]|uniref:Cytochrome c oxidase-assembly factor COX23, mitochondrial n=1 Tax=Nadsonia fulvescens var. elongata DSM 6958 TaxID=857566 RepID=A0A1E3PDX4_9ASCO|nr:hypothetical protein NADFUDRAFT_84159 [Nadsonia fulvescens var. elongata DSM 6958]